MDSQEVLGTTFRFEQLHLPGGGGVLNKFLYGVAPSQSPTLSLLCTIFHEKGTPFVYRLLLTNGTPFTYLV